MSVEKRAIREALRGRRKSLLAATVEAAGASVCAQLRAFRPYQTAAAIVAYIAHENEVPTDNIIADAVASERSVYLPQTGDGERLIRWRPGDPLSLGRGGVQQPLGGAPACPERPAIALVPVVGWDDAGARLGRGGGVYDRLFTALGDGIVRVGLAYECLRVGRLPRDMWDVDLHYVITEQRIVWCGDCPPPTLFQKGGLQLR